jgi:hypothetical protein
MLTCPPNLPFSPTHAAKRLRKAYDKLGVGLVHRIIGFALFLLGANRQLIAQYLGMPFGTFLSFLSRMEKLGLFGFQDRRSSSVLRQLESVAPVTLSVEAMGKRIEIPVVAERNLLEIPESNVLQSKVVLLTLLQSRFLSAQQVSEVLGLSQRHTRELSRRLSEQDVFALIDQRKGQLSDYRFTAELKAELIQQFAVDAISGQKTSSRYLAVQLAERCQTDLSERTIRFHMKRMGLSGIAKSLPKLVAALKKTPPDTEESGR